MVTLDTPIKFLQEGGGATHSRKKSYPINRWMRVKGELEMCQNGYHFTFPRYWRTWLTSRIHLLEAEEPFFDDDKFCARGIKLQPRLETWTPRAAVLFAADCAERVLPIFESAFPNDLRPRQAIEAVRSGSAAEAAEAARATRAAWAAAGAAAGAAEAAWATRATRAAGAAARAARAAEAAWAAWAAAGAAGAAAEAAGAAGAAWAAWAARAARAAAGAARAADRAARAAEAAEAAGAAEVKWQDARFLQYLNGEV